MTEKKRIQRYRFVAGSAASLGLYNAGLHGIFAIEKIKILLIAEIQLIERRNHFHGRTGLT